MTRQADDVQQAINWITQRISDIFTTTTTASSDANSTTTPPATRDLDTASTMSIAPTTQLSATYANSAAPSDSRVFTYSIPSVRGDSVPSTEERIASVAALKRSTVQLQADVNRFLTEKMEQEKAAGNVAARESREEENYGEEIIE